MALAMTLSSLDGVDDAVKGLYVAGDDGSYRLDLDGYEDPKGLKSALDKERTAAKDAARKLKEFETRFSGIDPEQVKIIMSKLENDEEAKLLAEGKLDDVVKKRLEKREADLQRQAQESLTKAEQAELKAKNFEMQVLKGQLSAAAVSDGVNMHPSAIKFAFLLAQQEGWKLDNNGEARLYEENGEVKLGKDGKTPFSLVEWLKDPKTREENLIWYTVQNNGGGSGGGGGNNGKVDLSRLPPRERLQKARELGIN